jgi:uncharacterized membrane protein
MYATHLHLMLTHFPIVGILIGIGILIYGISIKNDSVKKVALTLFIISGIFTIPIYFTGEWSKLIIEKVPGISDDFIKNHEDMAIKTTFLTSILLLLSIINLVVIKKQLAFAKQLLVVTLIFSIVTFTYFAKAANFGGEIRHSEIIEHQSN